MSTTTATSSRDDDVEGLLDLAGSCVSATERNRMSNEVDAGVQTTCDASTQSNYPSSKNSDVSVQTDMSFALVSLEIF